ncbi:MAG: DNA cytosine methyltransferase [Alphaproteobacteria bacterium]|nr:MAG: DNA cytosine methyltransferase [Alphaproteobacteria bacterium]
MTLTSLELCAGAGGQALGLENAGFEHAGLVEIDSHCCNTLRLNRPNWNVLEYDLNHFDARKFKGVDLVAGGVPCPPFSKAGKQLGQEDERNLFPAAIRVVDETRPAAVMFENVRGLMDSIFDDYRNYITKQIKKLGYEVDWRLLNASDFGVPQLRPRVIMVGIKKGYADSFKWPEKIIKPPTVGEALYDLMAKNKWRGVKTWQERASDIAPTLVGGSKKHGGPDLGPTRAKKAWASLGVNGHTIAEEAPERNFVGMPRLTVRMAARIQGFPDDWQFSGKKTSAYRQVGNAFPPPVAEGVAVAIEEALSSAGKVSKLKFKKAS